MSETMMNRPVTAKDIAAKLGLSYITVKQALSPSRPYSGSSATASLIRKTADEMGYDPKAVMSYMGKTSKKKSGDIVRRVMRDYNCSDDTAYRKLHNDPQIAEKYGWKSLEQRRVEKEAKIAEEKANRYYHGAPFRTKKERIEYMLHLRAEGYGNTDIAKKSGTTIQTVRRNIGPAPAELTLQNRIMGQKIRAQKNAARKAYLRNKPIAEYNAKVAERNAAKAKFLELDKEITPMIAPIAEIAGQTVTVPNIQLSMLTPTALM